jgi:hypothetical protein
MGYPGPAEFSVVPGQIQSSSVSVLQPTYQLTAPVRGGMSGGPVWAIDPDTHAGGIAGVILAAYSGGGEICLAGHARELAALLKRAEGIKVAPAKAELSLQMQKDYEKFQDRMTAMLKETFKNRTPFWGWMAPGSSEAKEDIYCGEFNTFVRGHSPHVRNCKYKLATESDRVTFEMEFREVEVLSNPFRTADLATGIANSDSAVATNEEERYFDFSCRPSFRHNNGKAKFLVSICSRADIKLDGLYESIVRISTLDMKKDGISAQLNLRGFSQNNTRTLIDLFVKGLEVSREPRKPASE